MIGIGNGETCDRCDETAVAVVKDSRVCMSHLETLDHDDRDRSLADTDPNFKMKEGFF